MPSHATALKQQQSKSCKSIQTFSQLQQTAGYFTCGERISQQFFLEILLGGIVVGPKHWTSV